MLLVAPCSAHPHTPLDIPVALINLLQVAHLLIQHTLFFTPSPHLASPMGQFPIEKRAEQRYAEQPTP